MNKKVTTAWKQYNKTQPGNKHAYHIRTFPDTPIKELWGERLLFEFKTFRELLKFFKNIVSKYTSN